MHHGIVCTSQIHTYASSHLSRSNYSCTTKTWLALPLIPCIGSTNTSTCTAGASRKGPCNTHCVCVGNAWTCCRLRQEFTHMTAGDREAFLRTFVTMTTREPYRSRYRALLRLHSSQFDGTIHEQSQFLPWHRWYLLQVENILQSINCSVTLPYFDWSAHSHRPWSAPTWLSTNLGGNGRCTGSGSSRRCCVTTGRFSISRGWRKSNGRCLEREFDGTVPDMPAVALVLRNPASRFNQFETSLRGPLHDGPHCAFGGDMCSDSAAEDPVFNLHHGFVDAIWYRWQARSVAHLRAYFAFRNTPLTGVSGATVKHYHDSHALPGGVNVCYEDPNVQGTIVVHSPDSARRMAPSKVITAASQVLSRLSARRLQSIPRTPYTTLSQRPKALRLFRVTRKDRTQMLKDSRLLAPKTTVGRCGRGLPTALDRHVGFRVEYVAARRRLVCLRRG